MPLCQSAEYDKRVANISLFIYIGGRAFIQIVSTCPDLVSSRQDLVATVASLHLVHIYINVCVILCV